MVGLDVFRGLTIAGMILVNNPGDWQRTWAPLLHAPWDGWTPTDLVFPFFLVAVGVAIPLSLGRRLQDSGGDLGPLLRQIARRTVLLFALGLFLAWFPFFTVDWSRARVMGVLQRIALVYAAAALAYLYLGRRGRLWLGGGLLAGYGALMKLVPVPGFGAGDLGVEGNLAAWVDSVVLGSHVWRHAPGPGDPEGLLSTLPAIVSALIGIRIGEWLTSPRSLEHKLVGLYWAGGVGMTAGLVLAWWWPVNKNLWSVSYTVFTGAMAAVVLAAIVTLIDLWSVRRWAHPFEVFGANSILAFVGSGLMARVMGLIRVGEPEVSLKAWLYGHSFERWLAPYWASFAWALAFVGLWWWVMWMLYRRRVFVRI
jgi:predicted acyltransferase